MLSFIYGFGSAVAIVLLVQFIAVRHLIRNPQKFVRLIMSKSLKNATMSTPFGPMVRIPAGQSDRFQHIEVKPDHDGG